MQNNLSEIVDMLHNGDEGDFQLAEDILYQHHDIYNRYQIMEELVKLGWEKITSFGGKRFVMVVRHKKMDPIHTPYRSLIIMEK